MKRFPVLWQFNLLEERRATELGCPFSVPWDLVAPHEAQARRNHGGQSLERLADRGGLSPGELVCVLLDRPPGDVRGWGIETMVPLLLRIVAEHEGRPR